MTNLVFSHEPCIESPSRMNSVRESTCHRMLAYFGLSLLRTSLFWLPLVATRSRAKNGQQAGPDRAQVLIVHGAWWQAYGDGRLPLHLDLGCGKGRMLLEMAKLHPQRNFLGMSRFRGCCPRRAPCLQRPWCPCLLASARLGSVDALGLTPAQDGAQLHVRA